MKIGKQKCLSSLVVKGICFLLLIGSLTISINSVAWAIGVTGTVNEEKINNNVLDSGLEKGKELYYQGRKIFYNAEAGVDEAQKILDVSKEIFGQLPDGFEKYFWQAQVEFTKARIAEYTGVKEEAVTGYTTCSDLVKQAFSYNKKSSEAHRLLSDTYLRLMGLKGPLFSMSYGPQAIKLLNMAIGLDKNNFAAYNSLGIYYYYAPKIGGGGVDKAIKTLKKALQSNNEYDNFISYYFLTTAYSKSRNIKEATAYSNKALAIYPNSPLIKDLLMELTK